ncbi:MAG: glycerol-3-phosphate 1-O-acyltransferase PlsY [Bacteroidales bacterium]
MLRVVFTVCLAYLLGSLPWSVWLGRVIKGIDLREHGSGNAGATNAFRVLGKPIGIVVLILDMGKGYAAVSLSFLQDEFEPGTESWMIFRIGLGLVSILGHVFPVFAGFRGGKGVAAMAGIGMAIHPFSALASMGVYLIVFLLSRISALGSLVAVLTYPVWIIWVFRSEFLSVRIFSLFVVVLVLVTHRSNILRMIQGKEKSLFRKA